ncbi:hypothetical protein [Streptomyces sp. t39]|uniref:hypothetical protein n=1 Tax=Streptomyces sp. t39 TaxID=1828156 RepID=UPI0011CDA28E|nr:hypothetical protein [Streptomyces sp. t39]TXS54413.1 hypothetical protein EAO77_18095 [Streptomyces sp. t39]
MRLYAQIPARRNRQVLGDVLAVALIAVTVWAALLVRDTIMLLAEPGRKVERSGDGLAEELGNASDAASDLPLIGGVLRQPLRSAADAGSGFADAGASFQDSVTQVADAATAALIVFPVLLVLVLWIPPRLLWIRRSAIVRRLADAPGGADLLALRALTGPPAALAQLPTPPGGLADAWRRGDRHVIAALGALALARTGLRP